MELIEANLIDASLFSNLSSSGAAKRKKILVSLYQYCSTDTGGFPVDHELLNEEELMHACGRGGHLLISEQTAVDKECAERIVTGLFALYDDLPEINDLDEIGAKFEEHDIDLCNGASIQENNNLPINAVYGGYLHPTARSPQSVLVRFLSDVVLVFSHHYRVLASATHDGNVVKVVVSEPLLSPTALSVLTTFTSMRGCDCPKEAPVSLEGLCTTEAISDHQMNDSDDEEEIGEKREINMKIRDQAIRSQQVYIRTVGLCHSFLLLARALLLTAALHFGTSPESGESRASTAGWKIATGLDTSIDDNTFSEYQKLEGQPKAKKGRKKEKYNKENGDSSVVLQWLFQYEMEEWSDEIVGLFPELDNLRRYFVIRLLESVKTSVFQQRGCGDEPLEVENYFTLLIRLCLNGDSDELCQHIVRSQQTRMALHRDIVLLLLGDLLAVLGPSKENSLARLFSAHNMEAPAKAVATAIMPRDLLSSFCIPTVHVPPQVVLHFGSDYIRSCTDEGYGPHPLALYAVDTIRRYVDGCLQLVRAISLGVSSGKEQNAEPTADVKLLIKATERNMRQLEDTTTDVQLIFSDSLKNGSLFSSRFFNIHCMSVASVGASLLFKMSVLFPDFAANLKVFPKLVSTASRCSETLKDIHSTPVDESEGTSTGILLGECLSEIIATFFIKTHSGHVLSICRNQVSFDNTVVNQTRPLLLLSVYLFLQSVNLCWNATLQYLLDYTPNSASTDPQSKRNELFCNYFNPVVQSMRRYASYQPFSRYHTDLTPLRSNESINTVMLLTTMINKAKKDFGIITEISEPDRVESELEVTHKYTKAFFLADRNTDKNIAESKDVIALCSAIPFVCLAFSCSGDTNGSVKFHHNTLPHISVPFRDALITRISKQVESFEGKLLLAKKDRAYEKKKKEWCETALGTIPLDYVIQTVIESLRCLDPSRSTLFSTSSSNSSATVSKAVSSQTLPTTTGSTKDQCIKEAERLFKHGEEEGSYEPFFEFLHKQGLLKMRKEAALIAQREELRILRGASDVNRLGKMVPLGDIAKKVRGGLSTIKNSEAQLGLLGPRGQLQRAGFISLFRGALKISHGLSEDDPFSSEPRVRAAHTFVARCLNQLPLDVRDHCTDLVCECLKEEIRLHQEAKKIPTTSDYRSIFSLCMQCLFIGASQSALIKHTSMHGETSNRSEITFSHLMTSSNTSEQLNIRKPLEWIQRASIVSSTEEHFSDMAAFLESDTLMKGNRYSHLAVRFFITLLSSGGRNLPESTILEYIHGCPVLTNFIWSTIHRRLCLGDASKQTVKSLLFSLAIPAFFESCDDAELGLTHHINTAGHRTVLGMNVLLSVTKHRPSYANHALSSLLYFCSDATAAGLRRDGTRRAALKAIQKLLLPVRVISDTEYCSSLAPYSAEETTKYEERIFEFATLQADKFISSEFSKNSGISVPKPILNMAESFDFCIQGNDQVRGLKALIGALPNDDTLATQFINELGKAIDLEHRLVYEWHVQYNTPVAEMGECPLGFATAIVECHVGLLLTIGTLYPGRFAARCLTKIMEVYSSIASSILYNQSTRSLRTAISTEVSSASLMRSLLSSTDIDLLIRQAFGGFSTKKETISFNGVQYTELVPDFTQAHRFLLFVMPTLRNYPNGANDIVFKVLGVLALCVRSLVADTCLFLASLEDSGHKKTIKVQTTKELEGIIGVLTSHCEHMFNQRSSLYILHHKHNSPDLVATPVKGDIRMMIPVLGFIPRDLLISRYIPALARYAVITKCNRELLMTTASYDNVPIPSFVSNHLSAESIMRQLLFPSGTMLEPITISSEEHRQYTVVDHTANVLPRSLCDTVADKVLGELLWHFLVPCKGGFLAYPGHSTNKYNAVNSVNKVGISPASLVKSLASFFSQIHAHRGIKDDLDILIFLQPMGGKVFRQFLGHLANTQLCPSVLPISPFSSAHIGGTSGAVLSHLLRDVSRYFPDGNYWEDFVKLLSNFPSLMNSSEAFQIIQQIAKPYGAAELPQLLMTAKEDLLGDFSVLSNIIQQYVVSKGIMAFSTPTSIAFSKQMSNEEAADMASKWPCPPSAVSLLSLSPYLAQLQVTVLSNMMIYQEFMKYLSESIDVTDNLLEMTTLSLELLHLSLTPPEQATKVLETLQKKLLPLQQSATTTTFPLPEAFLKLEDICTVFDGLFKGLDLSNIPPGYSNLNEERTSNEVARSLAYVIREAGEKLYKNAKPLLDRRPPPTLLQPPLIPEVNSLYARTL